MDEKEFVVLDKRMPYSNWEDMIFLSLVFRNLCCLRLEFPIAWDCSWFAFASFNILKFQIRHKVIQLRYWQIPLIKYNNTFPTLLVNSLSGTFIRYWHIIHILTSCSVTPYHTFLNKQINYHNEQCSKLNKTTPTNISIKCIEHKVCDKTIIGIQEKVT